MENIYLNVNIPNNKSTSVPAIYNASYPSNIIDNPEDYKMSVIRFTVESTMPIHIFEVQPNQPDINLGIYSVTLVHVPTSTKFQFYLQYIPNSIAAPPRQPNQTINGLQDSDTTYYYMYNYDHWAELINEALILSFNALKAAFPAIPHSEPPYILYDRDVGFSLVAETAYATSNDVLLFFNDPLYRNTFRGLRSFFFGRNNVDGDDFNIFIDIKGDYDNAYFPNSTAPSYPPSYIIMKPNFQFYNYFHSPDRILIVGNGIPSVNEFIQTGNILATNLDSTSEQFGIISDFVISSNDAGAPIDLITYLPTAQYRYINLKGQIPIRNLNIQIFWVDNLNEVRPLQINPRASCNLKILFEPKS